MKRALSMILAITLVISCFSVFGPFLAVSADASDDASDEVALPKTLVNPYSSEGRTLNFNQGWKFVAQYVEEAISPDYSLVELQKWVNVDLPHAVRLERYDNSGPDEIYMGDAMYIKHFPVSEENADKRIYITFNGVMGTTNIWVNGIKQTTKLGEMTGDATYYGGYICFVIDITDSLICDGVTENIIVVHANSKYDPLVPPGKDPNTLDFSYFGGIYRDVTMTVTDGVHITDANYENIVGGGGVLVDYPTVSTARADVYVKTHMRNETPEAASVSLKTSIVDANGVTVAEKTAPAVSVASGGDYSFEQNLIVNNPKLWDLKNPNLHTVVSTLYLNGEEIDRVNTRIGIRKIEMHKSFGLKINGVVQGMLSGTNRHQEYPYIGYAGSASLQRRDAYKFKEAGINIVRTAHYPASPDFLDACDELGILIIEPTPGWQYHTYEPVFTERVHNDIRQIVRRDRNRPCILAFETVLNETYDAPAGYTITMARVAKAEHPSCKVATETSVGAGEKDPVSDIMYSNPERSDFAVGFIREYGDSYREQYSTDNFFFRRVHRGSGMEYGFYPGGEGAMFMQAVKLLMGNQNDTPYYCPVDAASGAIGGSSGSGRSRLFVIESYLAGQKPGAVAYIGGTTWIGIDWNRSYDTSMGTCGMLDLMRLPKFAYYAMQSQRPVESDPYLTSLGIDNGPMVFVSSYWTAKAPVLDKSNEAFSTIGTDDERIILVWSNTEKVKLSVIDESGMVLYEDVASPMTGKNREYMNAPFQFVDVPYYENSYLLAEGFDASGKVIASQEVHTSGAPAKLGLEVDTMGITPVADGSDTVMVYGYILDENGNICQDAYNKMKFSIVSGDASIVGDGSPRVGSNPVNAEAGIFGVYVKMGKTHGDIVIKVESEGLEPCEVTITSEQLTSPASPYYEIAYTGKGGEDEGDYLTTIDFAAVGNVEGMLAQIVNMGVEINGTNYKNSALYMNDFDVIYDVGGGYNRFTADVTVFDNGSPDAAAIFKVVADGRTVYVSDIVLPGQIINIDVAIPNPQKLELITEGVGRDYKNFPQYVWLSPFLYSGESKINENGLYKNLALGKHTEASSTLEGFSSRYAVDGSESTVWMGELVDEGAASNPQYLIVDLGEKKDLSGARVGVLHDSIIYKYQIQVSEDKEEWHTVASVEKSGQATDIKDFFTAKDVRYVKILFTEIGTNPEREQFSNATVTDLQIYEELGVTSVTEFTLKNLGIYGKDMVFDPNVTDYTVNLEGYETELGIFTECYDKDATVTVNGVPVTTQRFAVKSIPSDGIIRVAVTSASGSASTEYKIRINGRLGDIFYDNARVTASEPQNPETRWIYQRQDTKTGEFINLSEISVFSDKQPYPSKEDHGYSWARMGSTYAHPGSNRLKVSRTYVAPISGRAELLLYAAKFGNISGSLQDGAVGLSVYKNGEKIWPLNEEHTRLDGGNIVDVSIPVTLAKGDRVYFLVDNWDGANAFDATYLDTTVCYVNSGAITADEFVLKHADILSKTVGSVTNADKTAIIEAIDDLDSSSINVRRELVAERRLLENLNMAINAQMGGAVPVGVESFAYTHSTGGRFIPPAVAKIYMSDGSHILASAGWTYDSAILSVPGEYRITGKVSGYDGTAYINLKVVSVSQNPTGTGLPMAFSSYSGEQTLAQLINDGNTESGWSNSGSANAQDWVGILFDGERWIDRLTLKMPATVSGEAQLPTGIKVQYYTGPAIENLPTDPNNLLGSGHELETDTNWTDAVVIRQDSLASMKTSAVDITPVRTRAIRVVVSLGEGAVGYIGISEMECHEAEEPTENVALNATNTGKPTGIASYSNFNHGPNCTDPVRKAIDGVVTNNNWTNKGSVNSLDWLGVVFETATEVDRIILHMPVISAATQVQIPTILKVQYYTGPAFAAMPKDNNNVGGSGHELDNDANWSDAVIVSEEALESSKASTIRIVSVSAIAIRVVMAPAKLPGTSDNAVIGVAEMEMLEAPTADALIPDMGGILVDGSPVSDFSADKTEYTVKVNDGRIPEVEAVLNDNSAVTVLRPLTAGGEVKLLIKSEDGRGLVIYTLRLDNSEIVNLSVAKNIAIAELEALFAEYNRADYTEKTWIEIMKIQERSLTQIDCCASEEELEEISLDDIKVEVDAIATLKGSDKHGTKVNLTLYSNISLNIYAPVDSGILGINVDGTDVPAIEEPVEIDGALYYAFIYSDIAPSSGARELKITYKFVYDGKIELLEFNYSILDYAEAVFTDSAVSDRDRELVKSVIAYIGAAYTYFGDAATTESQLEKLNKLRADYPADIISALPAPEGVDTSALTGVVNAAQLSFANGNIRMMVSLKDKNAPLTVKVGDRVVVSLEENHGQEVVYLNLRAFELSELVNITSGELVGAYSFLAYAEAVFGTDDGLDALLLALYSYADAAKDYRSNKQ